LQPHQPQAPGYSHWIWSARAYSLLDLLQIDYSAGCEMAVKFLKNLARGTFEHAS
jgi:hypothetical protein